MSESEPIKFSNEKKLLAQMRKRRWTETELREALRTVPIPTTGQRGAALRCQHPTTGKSLVVNAASGEIFHLGKEDYRYE